MTRLIRLLITLAALITLPLFVQPAVAATTGWSEKIDLVRDLPNEDPFVRDGIYYDLGYLWSSGGSANTGYVLYHEDRYVSLDAEKLAAVVEALGEDPTTGYVPPTGAAPAGSRRVTRDDYKNMPGMAGRSDASSSDRDAPVPMVGGMAVALSWIMFLVLGGVVMLYRVLRKAAVKTVRLNDALTSPMPEWHSDSGFDARVAARLAELRGGGGDPAPSPDLPAAPRPAGGFGRKTG